MAPPRAMKMCQTMDKSSIQICDRIIIDVKQLLNIFYSTSCTYKHNVMVAILSKPQWKGFYYGQMLQCSVVHPDLDPAGSEIICKLGSGSGSVINSGSDSGSGFESGSKLSPVSNKYKAIKMYRF